MYHITRIELTNFKLVDEKSIIEFKDNKLVVLDGPNGYGKTTIFDAIEILIKGNRNIDSIYNTEYREGDKPVVYANDYTKEIVIKGEFIDEKGNTFIIMRKIDNPSVNGKISELKERFSAFELETFEQNDGRRISQEEINSILQLIPNENVFNLMYYIQQEDTNFFLRKNENTRREEINKLFNMNQALCQYNKIVKLRDKLNSKKKQIGGTNKNGGKIKEINKKIEDLKCNETKKVVYFRLIEEKVIAWDKENVVVTNNNYSKIIDEINIVKILYNNFSDYCNYKYNKDIEYCLGSSQENILLESFVMLNHLDRYNDIKNEFNRVEKFKRLLDLLKGKEYSRVIDFIDKNISEKQLIDNVIDSNSFLSVLNNLIEIKKYSNELSDLLLKINSFRRDLDEGYHIFLKLNPDDEGICPFCGFDYKEVGESLVNKVTEKEEYFLKRLDSSSAEYRTKEGCMEDTYIKPLINFLKTQIENCIYKNDFIEALDKAYIDKNRIIGFKNFCNGIGIDINKYAFEVESYSKESEKINLDNLKKELSLKKKNIKNEEIIYKNYGELTQAFQKIFDGNEENVKSLNVEKIDQKLTYIDYMFFTATNNEKIKMQKQLQGLEKAYDILEHEYILCKDISDVFIKKLRSYSTQMVKRLQIPLYIYSGRIVQDYQGGLGVFIKTEDIDQQIRLKFVNSNDSKHDLINKFSSGQLSGLIISFMLSLNTVFSGNVLNTILIDDPLQSMDDINMTSFVELLRNEFQDSQIILSTHDERISRYIRYKFDKFGIRTLRYNVKEKLNNKKYV